MLKFEVNGKNGHYILNLPTNLSEITPEYLINVTKKIIVAPNYSLIGVVYREKLSNLILAARQRKKESNIAVIPIYVKGEPIDITKSIDNLFSKISICDRVIISPSDISLGHHVATPTNLLTINNFLDYTDGDTNCYQEALKHNDYCYFIEFKLVPNCNIHGFYDSKIKDKDFVNPFVFRVDSGDV